MRKKHPLLWLALSVFTAILCVGCGSEPAQSQTDIQQNTPDKLETDIQQNSSGKLEADTQQEQAESNLATNVEVSKTDDSAEIPAASGLQLADIPAYNGDTYIVINDNQPKFAPEELTTTAFEYYSPLDNLGRCGYACACVGQELMPTEERGAIGDVRPTGWHTVKYNDIIDGNYLYNRCHLIGYQLTGQNDEPRNLITGTRWLNTVGMLPFENLVGDYIWATGNHVLYRVTPLFQGDNLVASGVQLEAYSMEDEGEGVCFNVYIYNVQPGIYIDYATGDSQLADNYAEQLSQVYTAPVGNLYTWARHEATTDDDSDRVIPENATYVINTNSGKIHKKDCKSIKDMATHNMMPYYGTYEEAVAEGYQPCGNCKPERG